MKSLISRAMYHPLIALSMFYLIDLMHNVDYSLAGALLVLAARSISPIVRLINTGCAVRRYGTLVGLIGRKMEAMYRQARAESWS
jgi:hypothetical protein